LLEFGTIERVMTDEDELLHVRGVGRIEHGGVESNHGNLEIVPFDPLSVVRTRETERARIARRKDHGVAAEIVTTVLAARLPVGNENSQITRNAIDGGALGGLVILGPDV
jgi:hypothetical protein